MKISIEEKTLIIFLIFTTLIEILIVSSPKLLNLYDVLLSIILK